MTNHEPEYRIDKCPTCGHERQGPKIVRLTKRHKQEWDNIQKDWTRYINVRLAILFFLMIIGVGVAMLFALSETILHILLGIVFGAGAPLIWAYFLMFHWREKKLDEVIKAETEILARYGVKREEPHEISD